MSKWQVTHELKKRLVVANRVDAYSNQRIELRYVDNKLAAIVHVIDVPDEVGRNAAIQESRNGIAYLVDVLAYLAGVPVDIERSEAEVIATGKDASVAVHGVSTAQASMLVMHPIRLPASLDSTAGPHRLSVCVRLANLAQQAAVDADAVRYYYMIWEDGHGTPNSTQPVPFELKLARDFVSHGGQLDRKALLKWLETRLGVPTHVFDPTNRSHQELVASMRAKGQSLIDQELQALLGV